MYLTESKPQGRSRSLHLTMVLNECYLLDNLSLDKKVISGTLTQQGLMTICDFVIIQERDLSLRPCF